MRADEPVEPFVVAPILDLVDGVALIDEGQASKQPDWSFDLTDSGRAPTDALDQAADLDIVQRRAKS